MDLLFNPDHQIMMHSLNLCETFYHFWRQVGHARANIVLQDLVALGVESFDELDPSIWKKTAQLKTKYRPLALGDAVGVALSSSINGIFVTSDRKELTQLAEDGICKFLFIR